MPGRGLQDIQDKRRWLASRPGTWVGFLIPQAFGSGHEACMPCTLFTIRTVAVLRHRIAKCGGAKMSNLAEELDRGFRVAVLQLAIRRAHAAK